MQTTNNKAARSGTASTPRAHSNTKAQMVKIRRALHLLVDSAIAVETCLEENLDNLDASLRILKKNFGKTQKLLLAWRGLT